jgi:hypothetical protein
MNQLCKLREQNTGIILFCLFLFVVYSARLGYLIFQQESNMREYLVMLLGMGITGGAGNAFSEKIKFQFNRYEKAVRWSRKKISGNGTSGIIPFQDIVNVNLNSIGGGQSEKYRIDLVCRKQTVPISAVYSGDKEKHEQIIKRIDEYVKG